ncbi:MAG: Crp/Fnr family transcriptional regulator [Phycisphaerae bacterium]|nr:Crp/Fnr family transcriptional regulator [Phycisphaerae bacterium]MDW8261162.1 Crp/Fnr family transcriptional regulator [Phycisphaerales bacterium]
MNTASPDCPCVSLDILNLGADCPIEPAFRRLEADTLAWDSARADGKLLVVKEGILRLYHGTAPARRRLVGLIGPGHWLGAEVLAGVPGEARAYAATPALVALVDAGRVVEAALANRKLGAALIRHLSRQFCMVQEGVTEARFLDCTSQVVSVLLRLADCGAQMRDGRRITLLITQQDVADAVGIARETVNTILHRLADAGLIEKQRGRIILDEPGLRQWKTQRLQVSSAGCATPDAGDGVAERPASR